MASRTQKFLSHYQRILKEWPKDLLRPQVSFQTILLARRIAACEAGRATIQPRPAPMRTTVSSKTNDANASMKSVPTPNSKLSTPSTPSTQSTSDQTANQTLPSSPPRSANVFNDDGLEQGQILALDNLLNNNYTRRYPLSSRMMRPASRPDHYENLVRELDEVPNRGWLEARIKRIKSMFRWS